MQDFWLCLSAFLAGAINSIAGGGTLLTFPGEGHSLEKNPWHGKIKVREELEWLAKYGEVAPTH